MSAENDYRTKANELLMQSRVEANPDVKATLLQLAQGYGHLAELTEKKAANAPIVVPSPMQDAVEQSTGAPQPYASKEEQAE